MNMNEIKLEQAEDALKTLTSLTGEYRKAYVARVEELCMGTLVSMRKELADVGMDLNKIAPYPKSNIGRRQYHIEKDRHVRFTISFETDPASRDVPGYSDSGRLYGKCPWIVKEKLTAEADIRESARRAAKNNFDVYLSKLAKKIGQRIKEATMTGALWDNCKLEIMTETGERQVWKTKCIVNMSVYKRLFNQWPTRRLS